ncbi:MAG: Holliday junction branch migration protein RuvA [Malacoplasma sp.]|nr:Holliday junction branch migration protein RuvA [Malacoplasma sp.]
MLTYIIGKVVYISKNYILLENNGQGYKIFVSNPDQYKDGCDCKIFIFTKIYQNNKNNIVFELYGFTSVKEKIFFETLMQISGIGPKTGLIILKNDLSVLKNLIVNEDVNSLAVLEGFTNKTALAVVSALSYKMKTEKNYEPHPTENTQNNCETQQNYNATQDLISALKALGYKPQVIEKTVNNLLPQIANTKEEEISDLISIAIRSIVDDSISS